MCFMSSELKEMPLSDYSYLSTQPSNLYHSTRSTETIYFKTMFLVCTSPPNILSSIVCLNLSSLPGKIKVQKQRINHVFDFQPNYFGTRQTCPNFEFYPTSSNLRLFKNLSLTLTCCYRLCLESIRYTSLMPPPQKKKMCSVRRNVRQM